LRLKVSVERGEKENLNNGTANTKEGEGVKVEVFIKMFEWSWAEQVLGNRRVKAPKYRSGGGDNLKKKNAGGKKGRRDPEGRFDSTRRILSKQESRGERGIAGTYVRKKRIWIEKGQYEIQKSVQGDSH